MNVYESIPFWHTLFASLGFSVLVPDEAVVALLRDRANETVPSESVCHPAKLSHACYAALLRQGASVVFMPRYERGTRCPVACEYVRALRDNVGSSRLAAPVIKAIRPRALANRPADRDALSEIVNGWLQSGDCITPGEFDEAFDKALKTQEAFERSLASASREALDWLKVDETRRAAVVAGRPYHVDPALVRGIDGELSRLGFAVLPMLGLDEELHALRTKAALWKPSKHFCELVQFASANRQIEIVALRSFGCLYDAVSFDEARDLVNNLGRPFTELKIDDMSDLAHIRIRLRTLAFTTQASPRFAAGGGALVERSKCVATPDLCSTAKKLLEDAISKIEAEGVPECLTVPFACADRLTDALSFELEHLGYPGVGIDIVRGAGGLAQEPSSGDESLPKVGLLGNPLLVFDEVMNEHVADLARKLGWRVVYPSLPLIEVEDVRYIEQLDEFERQGVKRIVYLQSFGCLKGHVCSRGALHELAVRYPSMPITVIDYDFESSALNRENRIRLALANGIPPVEATTS